ncbi:MAG: hypothetical protein P1V97_34710, partial [Planctomycetota bacterium]|nr:hypothetical protein [Planctomycetota bacterium]
SGIVEEINNDKHKDRRSYTIKLTDKEKPKRVTTGYYSTYLLTLAEGDAVDVIVLDNSKNEAKIDTFYGRNSGLAILLGIFAFCFLPLLLIAVFVQYIKKSLAKEPRESSIVS